MTRFPRSLLSTDHRVLGRRFFLLALFSGFVGVMLSLLMRFHVVNPAAKVAWWEWLWPIQAAGGIMTPELYLSLMTIHGSLMVFFVLTVAPQHAFASYFLPAQIGSPRMAFPKLHALSFWLFTAALCLMLLSFSATGGGPLSGWTAYPPLSAVGAAAGPGQGAGQTLWILSVGVFAMASLLSAVNVLVTVIDLRARGMHLMQLPLTAWNWLATAALSIPAFTILLAAALLLLSDRHWGTSFFVPSGVVMTGQILPYSGGSPLLWQHLFWFFGHPEVYIAILPGMGVVTEVLATFARRPVYGYRVMVGATWAIVVLGLLVWGHHMFTTGLSPYSAFAFSLISLAVAVPSAIKTFHWIATIWGGHLRMTTAMLFAIAFVSVFVTGGLSGVILAQPYLDVYFHDTYFVVAHFHFIMGVSAVFGIFTGTYYWFPRMTGRLLNERFGKIHFYVTFIGVHLIFLPMHFLGLIGNPRRYAEFTEFEFLRQTIPIHGLITWAALVTGAAQLIFLWNLLHSWRHGRIATENPWNASTLEWERIEPLPSSSLESGRAGQTGLWTFAAIVVMWFTALFSAFLFRQGFEPQWTPAPNAYPLAIGAAVLAVAGLLTWSSRPELKPAWAWLGTLGALSLSLLTGLSALTLSGTGPALWFSRLLLGSFAIAGVLGAAALARAARKAKPLRWAAAVQLWVLLGLLWWISRMVLLG